MAVPYSESIVGGKMCERGEKPAHRITYKAQRNNLLLYLPSKVTNLHISSLSETF